MADFGRRELGSARVRRARRASPRPRAPRGADDDVPAHALFVPVQGGVQRGARETLRRGDLPDAAPWPDAGGDEKRRRRLLERVRRERKRRERRSSRKRRKRRRDGRGAPRKKNAPPASARTPTRTPTSRRRTARRGRARHRTAVPATRTSRGPRARRFRRLGASVARSSRGMDRVTVQLFGSAPVVAHAVVKRGARTR